MFIYLQSKTKTIIQMKNLKEQLNNLKTEKIQLINNYKIIPSDDLQERIIDLGKKIGTITYEINFISLFGKN